MNKLTGEEIFHKLIKVPAWLYHRCISLWRLIKWQQDLDDHPIENDADLLAARLDIEKLPFFEKLSWGMKNNMVFLKRYHVSIYKREKKSRSGKSAEEEDLNGLSLEDLKKSD